ncbi:MAG: SpoIIE family protein phosphatase [Bacteroidia bacterium]|nr:SpoIIE family protein phosphatase [Bacteroidia bacterium]
MLLSCQRQTDDVKHYSGYYDLAGDYLSARNYAVAALYVDSIRNFGHCDTPGVANAMADCMQAWISIYDLDEATSYKYSKRAFRELIKYGSTFSREISELASLLAYGTVVDKPDSALYYCDICLEQPNLPTSRIVEARLYKAEAYRNSRRYDECIIELQGIQSITDTIQVNDAQEEVSWILCSLIECADLSCFVGDFRRCNNYLASAARWYDVTTSADDRLMYLECRARAHFVQAHYSLANSYANRLNNMAIANGQDAYQANALAILGLSHSRNSEIDEAIHCKEKIDSLVRRNPKLGHSVRKERIFLDGEIAAYRGNYKESHRLLFDSIGLDRRTFEYDQVLRSRQVYYLVQGDYKSLYKLEETRKAYVDSVQTNVIFKNEQRQIKLSRDVAELLRAKIKQQEELLSVQSSTLFVERLIFVSIVVIIASVILILMRRNVKNRTRNMLAEKKRLEDEIADKIKALEQQKEMFRRTNQRISESISYAERIQHSIMPLPEALNEYDIEGGFIFNSPLDVVSGDFYWFTQKGDNLLVACADCTGHGVPGAFMSMIASTTINDFVNKSNDDVTPAEILEDIDSRIVEILAHNTSESGAAKDGLDIALVSINLKTLEVITSAARRPIIITRDQEIISVAGTKRSIGDVERLIRKRQFVNERFQLHRGDGIYMFSDGYTDQFGGPEGDKLKVSKVKRFLRAIHDDDIDEQCLTIQELFTQWKGDYPQIDDVLFIGIKL